MYILKYSFIPTKPLFAEINYFSFYLFIFFYIYEFVFSFLILYAFLLLNCKTPNSIFV